MSNQLYDVMCKHVMSVTPDIRLVMREGQEPWPPRSEKALPDDSEISPAFYRKEMYPDEVDFYNRYNYPFHVVGTEAFEEWATAQNIRYKFEERIMDLISGSNSHRITTVMQTRIVFENETDQMLFKLTWA